MVEEGEPPIEERWPIGGNARRVAILYEPPAQKDLVGVPGWLRVHPDLAQRPAGTPSEFHSLMFISMLLPRAGDGEQHTDAQRRLNRVAPPRTIPSLPDVAGQRLGQAEPEFGSAQKHKPTDPRRSTCSRNRRSPSSDGPWKIQRQQGIFCHGGRDYCVASVERRREANFYPTPTTYATSSRCDA